VENALGPSIEIKSRTVSYMEHIEHFREGLVQKCIGTTYSNKSKPYTVIWNTSKSLGKEFVEKCIGTTY